ncbi:Uma2 family endonuclease [Streptoalloteichus hindustanus]|uniref:Endonuclease, Uma2 family (Restriction endonuclease fold) n=1 Tax=Streptoalloteichus hindustanus TaxID=2017 RepID=A0A1M4Z6E7_STRHI|nr:Uma2 family endonuclease [Streptoalloteichus hindustanus]SHF13555.1 Endonuclease, Uma2 family (restriction endonuclease fold) [Streptoalloteichus hindustanus]
MTTPQVRAGDSITVDEFDALPRDDEHRHEIEDGRILVLAGLSGPHLRTTKRLVAQLDEQLPDEFEAIAGFEVELSGPSPRRVPDVVVADTAVWDQARIRAEQIVLAVEIVSPGHSAARDYIRKPREYAANNIPLTWVVDIQEDLISLTAYTLDDTGQYHFTSPLTGIYEGQIAGHSVTIDLQSLTYRRRPRD